MKRIHLKQGKTPLKRKVISKRIKSEVKLSRFGSWTLPASVVQGYNNGTKTFDDLLDAIGERYGKMMNLNWRQSLTRMHLYSDQKDEAVKKAGRYTDFWLEDDYSTQGKNFGAKNFATNLNIIFDKTTNTDPTKQAILKDFGANVDFIMWEYDKADQAMFLIKDGVKYEVKVIDTFEGDYQSNTLVYTKIGEKLTNGYLR